MFEKTNVAGHSNPMRFGTRIRNLSAGLILTGVLIAVFIVALFLGKYTIDPITVVLIVVSGTSEALGNILLSFTGVRLAFLWGIPHTWNSTMDVVIWNIRLPRAIAVILVGSGLAISGAAFQGTFRNPLVSESILGVSAGAGVGAALGILMSQAGYMIQVFAFAGGLLAVSMTFAISRVYKSNPTLVLVLAGIIVGSLFSAVTSAFKYVADPYTKLPDIVFWLMGSFAKVSMNDVVLVAPVILICTCVMVLMRWRLNVLSMGDEEARALGVNTRQLRLIIIFCATLITSAAVCISGLVGWVGLIIPQMARMLVGPDHKVMIPASILLGATYMLVVDTICRNLTSAEIPVSIVTSIIGAPLFLYLLKKAKESWS